MIKLLDYYYMILLRFYDEQYKKDVSADIIGSIISLTLTINIVSLFIMLGFNIFDLEAIWFCFSFALVSILIHIIIAIIYNKKRRNMLREKYKNDSYKLYNRRLAYLILYWIFTIAFLIFAIWYAG